MDIQLDFLHSKQGLQTWVELAESYWRQFVWSPYHAAARNRRGFLPTVIALAPRRARP